MIVLDPFSFFLDDASAFVGLGGQETPQDPRYCFHTAYVDLPPGRANFILRLGGVEAHDCELNVRVMAFRPGGDASMVTSLRIDMDNVSGVDFNRRIRFLAVEGVQYALYGYLTEPREMTVTSIDIELIATQAEAGAGSGGYAVSQFAQRAAVAPVFKLFSEKAPSLRRPMSQPYTPGQFKELVERDIWPELDVLSQGELDRWRCAMALQVMKQAGMIDGKARGVIVGAREDALQTVLSRAEVVVTAIPEFGALSAAADMEGSYDFAVGHPLSADEGTLNAALDFLLGQLADGGLAMIFLPIAAGPEENESRNIVQRMALRVICEGHQLSQLSLPDDGRLTSAASGEAEFALIVRKSISADGSV